MVFDMKKIAILVICNWMCITIFAQQQYSISGMILLGDEPAVYATVTLLPGPGQKRSNDNGFFRFSKLVPGDYQLKISVVGYLSYDKNISLTDKSISLDINLFRSDSNTLT